MKDETEKFFKMQMNWTKYKQKLEMKFELSYFFTAFLKNMDRLELQERLKISFRRVSTSVE